MREIVHIQAGQCGNQIGAKVSILNLFLSCVSFEKKKRVNSEEWLWDICTLQL